MAGVRTRRKPGSGTKVKNVACKRFITGATVRVLLSLPLHRRSLEKRSFFLRQRSVVFFYERFFHDGGNLATAAHRCLGGGGGADAILLPQVISTLMSYLVPTRLVVVPRKEARMVLAVESCCGRGAGTFGPKMF